MSDRKKMYGPQDKPYSQDINDLVEEDVQKGGAGSGIKGHVTLKDYHKYEQMKEAAKRGDLNKLRGAAEHFQQAHQQAKRMGSKEHIEHYKKLHHEALSHVMNRLDAGTRDMKKSQEEVEKGGVGSGVRGHKTQHPGVYGSPSQPIKNEKDRQKHAETRRRSAEADLKDREGMGVDEAYVHARKVSESKTHEQMRDEMIAHHKKHGVSYSEESPEKTKLSYIHHVASNAMYGKKKTVKKSHDPRYDAQQKPYTEDLNDMIEKGGVGSGIRGHSTLQDVERHLGSHRLMTHTDRDRAVEHFKQHSKGHLYHHRPTKTYHHVNNQGHDKIKDRNDFERIDSHETGITIKNRD